ncbi:MAG TPA: hypothetical protein VHZ51_04635 [Ktedonobacteraceae bacterium]|nr:hypothetical protein [Ktedonobacteraceae bacterium]
MEEQKGRTWPKRVIDAINPLRDPSLLVAAVLTFIEEAGQPFTWYSIIIVALINWLVVRGVVWLVVNFIFASTFIGRRLWWGIQNPQLAWRLLDAVGHEEIVIGGLPAMSESVIMQDGTTLLAPVLSASGIQIVGELPAGTELPMLGMPGGQMGNDMSGSTDAGFFPGVNPGMYGNQNGYQGQSFQQMNNGYISSQNTGEMQPGFGQRNSEEEERLRQQLAAYERLLEDWMQYTEDKWRTVSDSQLGWKPLRGRWGDWNDIFQDVYAAKTSDPMAKAAQDAGEATARRFDTSKDKGSAASAVACFIRDMMTLRSGLDMVQQTGERVAETTAAQPVVQPFNQSFSKKPGGSPMNGNSGFHPRSTLIRRPSQIFVDADSNS